MKHGMSVSIELFLLNPIFKLCNVANPLQGQRKSIVRDRNQHL